MKVLKFGGTSLGSMDAIRRVKDILLANDSRLIAVVSAIGESTDTLTNVASLAECGDPTYLNRLEEFEGLHFQFFKELCPNANSEQIESILNQLKSVCQGVFLLKELTDKSLDFILSSGELLSSVILFEFLKHNSVDAKLFDSRDIIKTDDEFGNAAVDFELTNKTIHSLNGELKGVNVFPGFIASTYDGETTTLGRGGSDYTASILAAGFKTASLEIWTDVDGIMTADPRLVKRAHSLSKVSYQEALELSHFGAKVLYYQSILPVYRAQIPIKVKNTFDPEVTGSLVSLDNENGELIKGIASIDDLSILTVSGSNSVDKMKLFSSVMSAISNKRIQCVFVSHSSADHSITLCVRTSDVEPTQQALADKLSDLLADFDPGMMVFESGYALIALVGSNMKDQVGVSGNMFQVLGRNGVSIKAIAQGSSELNISAIIPSKDLSKSLNVLHESFFLSRMKRINLFIIGAGNVGKAFIDQVTRQFTYLKEHHHINLKLIGIANSRTMNFEKDGIPLSKWSTYLANGKAFDKKLFVDQMMEFNYRNSIFIDITASYEIAELYQEILGKSISVVTPNKIAATRSLEEYKGLKAVTKRTGSQFLIETNVCAGLPVLSTLSDLVRSGDQVSKLEAVLSGTLNFLFNEYTGDTVFSEVIKKAKSLGYTEPDPRLDLSGEDVARKLLILIRESGFDFSMDEIEMVSFLPKSCSNSKSLEDFYQQLDLAEQHFKSLVDSARKNGTRLKVVASYEEGKAKVGLREIEPSHPFYNLEGKDNVVLFHTDRYKEQPLVIKGAGAGAEVTASGIFADVLRIAQSDI